MIRPPTRVPRRQERAQVTKGRRPIGLATEGALSAARPRTIGPVVGSPALAAGSGTLTNEKEREAPMRAHTHSPEFAPRDEAGPMLDRGALLSSDRGDVGNLRRIQPSEFYGLFATLATAPTETHGKNVGAPFSDVKLQVGALFFALV